MQDALNEDLHFNLEAAFQEILRRRQEQGAYSQEEYNQIVEDLLDEKVDQGELSDDDDIGEWTEQLQNRWSEVEELDSTLNPEE